MYTVRFSEKMAGGTNARHTDFTFNANHLL